MSICFTIRYTLFSCERKYKKCVVFFLMVTSSTIYIRSLRPPAGQRHSAVTHANWDLTTQITFDFILQFLFDTNVLITAYPQTSVSHFETYLLKLRLVLLCFGFFSYRREIHEMIFGSELLREKQLVHTYNGTAIEPELSVKCVCL